ncbi:T9SS type A sorting domain-containing protein [bacterium]|nr:T9SS type A sorting domain-containing protein [bacterium]
MKNGIVLLLAACFLVSAASVFGDENEVYGQQVLALDRESFQNYPVPWPTPGTKPSDEWLEWETRRTLASYQLNPVWLPDGQTIACSNGAGAYSSIFLVPVDGGDPVRFYTCFWVYQGYYIGSTYNRPACMTPDGEEIVFETHIIDESRGTQVTLHFNSDGAYSGCGVSNPVPVIQAINIHTKEVRTLVEEAANCKFSHNGKYFAYFNQTYDGVKNDNFVVQDTETGCEWTLPVNWEYCFSADDEYIIYADYTNGGQLFRIPVAGGAPEQITFDTGDELTTVHSSLECSPDGKWILFSGNGGPRSNTISDSTGSHSYSMGAIPKLCAYNFYTGETIEFFPRAPAISSRWAIFSPDGTRFCYVYENSDQRHQSIEIYVKDFDCSSVNMSLQTAVDASQPSGFALLGNYPNPFNPSTTIEFTLPEAGFADLVIYSITGQKVRELVSDYMTEGRHSSVWDSRDDFGQPVSAGVYVSRLRMNGTAASIKITLMK